MVVVADIMVLAKSVHGWMQDDELAWLHEQAQLVPAGGRWVEVGVWEGRSFAAVAGGLPAGCHLVAVDHWRGNATQLTCGHQKAVEPGFKVLTAFIETLKCLLSLRPDLLYEVLTGDSSAVGASYPPECCDVVFIDAGHEREEVEADLRAWLPRVRPGGMLCGHDWNYGTVRAAVDAVLGDVEHGARDIWWKRVQG